MGGTISPVSAPTMPAIETIDAEKPGSSGLPRREAGIALVPADFLFHAAPNSTVVH
jgi:hypothetical protein